MIKVAIFGGSFDPPHKGHQAVVEKALKELNIDKLIILPAFLNPFKESTLASPEERLAWCHQLFGDISGVEVSDHEIRSGRPVYTSESLRYFQKTYDVAYLIIGTDNLASITKWHEFNRINNDIIWVIADRKEHPLHTEMLQNWVPLKVDAPVSSTEIRESGDLSMVDNRIKDEVKTLLYEQRKK
ncbi:MAG: nicotinate (nicotinamide) nucleotide adenylyltransferase [Campylobacterota bacterium]|nr:nicotinate (nicotinamide) nucleotide adenylyltransferase [Campylobacterota bacterium]